MSTNDSMGDSPTDSAMFLAAERELARACVGWRRHQRCVDEDDRQLPDPHPACLAAQRRYVVFLVDHGLLSRDRARSTVRAAGHAEGEGCPETDMCGDSARAPKDVVFGSVIAWDWGDAGPWLVLIIALVVAVAFVAGQLDGRSSLASHVYVVLSKSTTSDDRPGEAAGHVSVRPANYGEAPIFGLAIALHAVGHRRRSWRFQPREQWWTGAPVPGGVRSYPMIEPDSSGQTVELPVPEGLPAGRDPQVILTFRDSNGRRWVRWPNGKLQSASLTRRWKAHRPANRPPVV